MSNLEKMLWALREGEVDFGAFVAGTRQEYGAMARYLLRKWQVPAWFGPADVEQELYIETWHHVWGGSSDPAENEVRPGYRTKKTGEWRDWDPSRGVPFSRWVVFGAMVAAKRALHKARGVAISGTPDKKRSRHEIAASELGEEGAALLDRLLAEAPTAEAEISRVQELRKAATRALRSCSDLRERSAVLAIREAGSLDGAGRILYEDLDHRVALRLGDEEAADRFVQKHAARVARRMTTGRANPG